MFGTRSLVPEVRPSPQIEVRWELDWHRPKTVELPKIWRDHYAAVADFNRWKARHPGDGTMTVLRNLAPYIVTTVAMLTVNPIALVVAYGMWRDRERAEN